MIKQPTGITVFTPGIPIDESYIRTLVLVGLTNCSNSIVDTRLEGTLLTVSQIAFETGISVVRKNFRSDRKFKAKRSCINRAINKSSLSANGGFLPIKG
jgi:hypothetical protein